MKAVFLCSPEVEMEEVSDLLRSLPMAAGQEFVLVDGRSFILKQSIDHEIFTVLMAFDNGTKEF